MAGIPRWRIIGAAVCLALTVAILVPVYRNRKRVSAGPLQTVDLSMRDYTFNGTNPTFSFRAGDRVRFVIRNDEETPIRHNFAIPTLGIPCEKELQPGEIRHVFVTLKRPGTYEYLCCTHRGMGGTLIVR